ncbi:MAG: hypothetical protein QWI73_06130 [Alphaproteobacteria bacterium]|nr:hypothetical protein [Alphaproteobacteria bacterium]
MAYQKNVIFIFIVTTICLQTFPVSFGFSNSNDNKTIHTRTAPATIENIVNNILLPNSVATKASEWTSDTEESFTMQESSTTQTENSDVENDTLTKVTILDLPGIPVLSITGIPSSSKSTTGLNETINILEEIPNEITAAANIVAKFTESTAEGLNLATSAFINGLKDLEDTQEIKSYEAVAKLGEALKDALETFLQNLTKYANEIAVKLTDKSLTIAQQYVYDAQNAVQAIIAPIEDTIYNFGKSDTVLNENLNSSVTDTSAVTNEMLESIIGGLGNFSNALFNLSPGINIVPKGPDGFKKPFENLFLGEQNTGTEISNDDRNVLEIVTNLDTKKVPFLMSNFVVNARDLHNALQNNTLESNMTESITTAKLDNLNDNYFDNLDKITKQYANALLETGKELIATLNSIQTIGDLTEDDSYSVTNLITELHTIMEILMNSIPNGNINWNAFEDNLSALRDSLLKFSNATSIYRNSEKPLEPLEVNLFFRAGLDLDTEKTGKMLPLEKTIEKFLSPEKLKGGSVTEEAHKNDNLDDVLDNPSNNKNILPQPE